MNQRVLAIVGVVLVIVVVALLVRRASRQEELAQERQRQEAEARRRVDLSTLPPAPGEDGAPLKEEPKQPKFKKKPIVVEMSFKQKHGTKLRPYQGPYQVMNASGDVVGEDRAPASGEPAVFILTPGRYDVVVPGSHFRQQVTLVGDEGGKTKVKIVVAK